MLTSRIQPILLFVDYSLLAGRLDATSTYAKLGLGTCKKTMVFSSIIGNGQKLASGSNCFLHWVCCHTIWCTTLSITDDWGSCGMQCVHLLCTDKIHWGRVFPPSIWAFPPTQQNTHHFFFWALYLRLWAFLEYVLLIFILWNDGPLTSLPAPLVTQDGPHGGREVGMRREGGRWALLVGCDFSQCPSCFALFCC